MKFPQEIERKVKSRFGRRLRNPWRRMAESFRTMGAQDYFSGDAV